MIVRGATADSLAALTSELDSALSGGADATTMGTDLFGVARLLRREPSLRRTATDVSVDANAKRQLFEGILAGKVSAPVSTLVGSAVSRRWTLGRDLGDVLEHLGVVATVHSAGDAERLSNELFALGQVVGDNPSLRDALSDPARSEADKSTLLSGLLAGKALPATITLGEQALAGTYRTVTAALSAYQGVAAEVHQQRVATVRVARPLSDAEQQRLTEILASKYHRPIHLNVVVDPGVIGGIKVEIGDDVIDGTVVSRLDDARRRLAG